MGRLTQVRARKHGPTSRSGGRSGGRSVRRSIYRSVGLGLGALLVAGLALPGCSGTSASHRDPAPRDLLTDLQDDGSLKRGLSHPEARVRAIAVRGLARMPAGDSPAALLSASNTEGDSDVLVEMCFALGQWQANEGTKFLVRMTEHEDGAVRAAALTALGRLAADGYTPLVVAALNDQEPRVRQAAALTLHRFDGRRYDHPRSTTEEELMARDAALARAALQDPDVEVRWRATYTLAGLEPRPGQSTILIRSVRDARSPLSRLFALRGLSQLDDAPQAALEEARIHLVDDDVRVCVEAARIVAANAPVPEVLELATHDDTQIRLIAVEGLRSRAADPEAVPLEQPSNRAWRGLVLGAFEDMLQDDPSAVVRREVRASLVVLGDRAPEPEAKVKRQALAAFGETDQELNRTLADPATRMKVAGEEALVALVTSPDRRDRERLGQLLASGELDHRDLLNQLLDDPVPSVVATALGALGELDGESIYHDQKRLEAALASDDPAIRGSAASVARPLVAEGSAPPWLVLAVADSMESSEGFEMEEARAELGRALLLPELDPVPPSETPPQPLLDRMLAEHDAAERDPSPEVILETTRGRVRLVLDRVTAPRHVESFLELADAGYYDGLDFHRVVPNFVVQGLDPRRDGWGVGGRRVPDEFSPTPYLSGTIGMPHSGGRHTGGCQIFITQVPTPHLDGAYTSFGHVVDGLDIIETLEIGDVVEAVRRVKPGES